MIGRTKELEVLSRQRYKNAHGTYRNVHHKAHGGMEKFETNSVKKNVNEILDRECDFGDIRKEDGFEDDRKNYLVDWKKLVFERSGNGLMVMV